MRFPPIRIVWAMAFIALVALELAAMRAIAGFTSPDMTSMWLVMSVGLACQGVLTVLAIGLLVGYRSRASRPFVVGFEVFGIAALGLYIAGVVTYSQELILQFQYAVRPLADLLRDGPFMSTGKMWLAHLIIEILVSLPLLAMAAIGGFLTHSRSALGIIAVLAGPPIGVLLAWLGVAWGMVQPADVQIHTLAGAVFGLLVGIVLGVLIPSSPTVRRRSRPPAAEVPSQEAAHAQDQG
jgi:hypothetical protein